MARTRNIGLGGMVVLAVMLSADRAGAGQDTGNRVRTDDPVLVALIGQATERSATFRRLVDAIKDTDGVVYVERGRCGHGVRSCLAHWVAVAGPSRILRVIVDRRNADVEAMVSIAHELQHALEILAEPSVKTAADIYFFYQRNRAMRGDAFETEAAVDAGNTVREELKKTRQLGSG